MNPGRNSTTEKPESLYQELSKVSSHPVCGISGIVLINVCYIMSKGLFPAYAKLQDDTNALRPGFLGVLQYAVLSTRP
jgi:hypothetical protein